MTAAHTNYSGNIKYALIVASVATAAALLTVMIFFHFKDLVLNLGDPYGYGKIAHGFVEQGFTKLTRRAASLYPMFIAASYELGADDRVIIFLQCLFHAATCVLAFWLGLRIYNARSGLLAGLFCAFHPMLLRYVPAALWMLPAIWQLIFSLGVFSSCRFLPRPMLAAGTWYLLTSLVCLAFGDSRTLSPWAMGISFGVGQLLVAGILFIATHAGADEN